MAANNTAIDTNLTNPRLTMEMVNHLRSLNQGLPQLKTIMDAYVNGADFTALEAAWGLSAGQGSPLWYLISGASTALTGNAVLQQMASWINPKN
jgi:hypothetical protein